MCARLPRNFIMLCAWNMDDGGLSEALSRAERAVARIEKALANVDATRGQDDQLRSKVRDAIAELDQLIRASGETEKQDG